MTDPQARGSRLRAYIEFLFAVFYFFLSREIARRAALGLASDPWFPLTQQLLLASLLVVGYAIMGMAFDRQANPLAEQGLPLRKGWSRELALGLAAGWGLAVVCVLPLALDGGIATRFAFNSVAWGWLISDTAFFACAALAEEVAFRGYAFQRFAGALGRPAAAVSFTVFYAIVQYLKPGSGSASFAVSLVFGLLLTLAYLRTRALWVSWGLNFAWKACRALLFGLTISGDGSHSPVIQGDPMGPFWLTGGGFGLDASWLTFVLMLAAIPLVYRLTRDLDFQYNAPVIVPAGIPVDIDAAARAQHEAAMGPAAESAAPALVQIMPAAAPSPVQLDAPAPPQATNPSDSDS
jgi:uncharacterized protein